MRRFWTWLDAKPVRWCFLFPLILAAFVAYMDRTDPTKSYYWVTVTCVVIAPFWLLATAEPPKQPKD